jgi:predicted ArsR family transcriptional regulator
MQHTARLRLEHLSRQRVAEVLIDLKNRIKGDFYVAEENKDRIVFASRSCPFGKFVESRPALCMMTSNVFGYVAAENVGYARVQIEGAVARGDSGCRVTVFLTPSKESRDAREYFKRDLVESH